MAYDLQSLGRDGNGRLLIGGHVSMAAPDFFVGSVNEALRVNSTAFMIFMGPPQSTMRRDVPELSFDEGWRIWKEHGMDQRNVAVHFPYVINPSTLDEEKAAFYCEFIEAELCRMEEAGLSLMCLHPGSAKGGDRATQFEFLINRVRPIFRRHPRIRCSFESMTAKGATMNVGLYECEQCIKAMDLPNFGITLDTCHLWDSGEDIADHEGFLRKIERTIGFDKVFLIHLNDSLNPRGSNMDRHARIGEGMIGDGNLAWFALLDQFKDVPKILETPINKESDSRMREISLLKSLQS